jgi:hypothetical protein
MCPPGTRGRQWACYQESYRRHIRTLSLHASLDSAAGRPHKARRQHRRLEVTVVKIEVKKVEKIQATGFNPYGSS